LMTTPLCGTWMTCMGPINIQRWLTQFSWMISSMSFTVGVICNKCVIPNYSYHSWHGKVCCNIWRGPRMDDYHEFRCAHEIQIK
jgi:hypothetical protein